MSEYKHDSDGSPDLAQNPPSIPASTECPTCEYSNVDSVLAASSSSSTEGPVCLRATARHTYLFRTGPATFGITSSQPAVLPMPFASHPGALLVPTLSDSLPFLRAAPS